MDDMASRFDPMQALRGNRVDGGNVRRTTIRPERWPSPVRARLAPGRNQKCGGEQAQTAGEPECVAIVTEVTPDRAGELLLRNHVCKLHAAEVFVYAKAAKFFRLMDRESGVGAGG